MMEPESLKRYAEALPSSRDQLLSRLAYVLSLPNVQKVTIDTKELEVLRVCRESETVLPVEVEESVIPVAEVVANVSKESHPFDPEEHPYHVLEAVTRNIHEKKLSATHVVAPAGEWLAAWLGLDREIRPGDKCFGLQVVYSEDELMNGKIVFLASSSPIASLAGASYGVIVELGIDTKEQES